MGLAPAPVTLVLHGGFSPPAAFHGFPKPLDSETKRSHRQVLCLPLFGTRAPESATPARVEKWGRLRQTRAPAGGVNDGVSLREARSGRLHPCDTHVAHFCTVCPGAGHCPSLGVLFSLLRSGVLIQPPLGVLSFGARVLGVVPSGGAAWVTVGYRPP